MNKLTGLALDHNAFTANLPDFARIDALDSVSLEYNCFDIAAGSQPRPIIDAMLSAGKTVTYAPQNEGCAAAVVDRRVFYNGSAWDRNIPAVNADDDDAVATDKSALLPGGTATFANYTSFNKGINGIMIDIAGLLNAPTDGDFAFKVGNDNNPGGWADAPAPTVITVRPGAGLAGSDRIELVWSDNAIRKKWLQVTVLPTVRTGLDAPDIFYFGNAIGESGNSASDAKVDPSDELLARSHPRNVLNPAPLDSPYDYNRDKRVDPADQLIARSNQTSVLTALRLISPP